MGVLMYYTTGFDVSGITIQVFQIENTGYLIIKDLLNTTSNVTFQAIIDGNNCKYFIKKLLFSICKIYNTQSLARVVISNQEYWANSPWMYFYEVSLGLLEASLLAVAILKYHTYWKKQGFVKNIPQTCILLEGAGLLSK